MVNIKKILSNIIGSVNTFTSEMITRYTPIPVFLRNPQPFTITQANTYLPLPRGDGGIYNYFRAPFTWNDSESNSLKIKQPCSMSVVMSLQLNNPSSSDISFYAKIQKNGQDLESLMTKEVKAAHYAESFSLNCLLDNLAYGDVVSFLVYSTSTSLVVTRASILLTFYGDNSEFIKPIELM